MNVSTVFAIQTEGQDSMDRWVTTFRIEYSQNCATFSRVLDVGGNNRVRLFWICFDILQSLTYWYKLNICLKKHAGNNVERVVFKDKHLYHFFTYVIGIWAQFSRCFVYMAACVLFRNVFLFTHFIFHFSLLHFMCTVLDQPTYNKLTLVKVEVA